MYGMTLYKKKDVIGTALFYREQRGQYRSVIPAAHPPREKQGLDKGFCWFSNISGERRSKTALNPVL